MSRIGKTAAIAALGGSCFALALSGLAADRRTPEPAPPPESSKAVVVSVPARCRTATLADTECETAWAAKRRRFLGQEGEAR